MFSYKKLVLVIAVLLATFGQSFILYVNNSANLYYFNDDSVQYINPFLSLYDNELNGPTYEEKYYLDVIYPIGYKYLFFFLSEFFSPITLSKVLPVFTFFMFLVCMGFAAWKIGREIGIFVVLSLSLSARIFLERMAGGLPRAFSFPILALALGAGLYGNIYLLAFATVLGAMFYPVTGVISGIYLAMILLTAPKNSNYKYSRWSIKKRIIFLVVVGGVSLLLLSPQLIKSSKYGGGVRTEIIQNIPEVRLGGRYSYSESLEKVHFLRNFLDTAENTIIGSNDHFFEALSLANNEFMPAVVINIVLVLFVLFSTLAFFSWKRKDIIGINYSLFFISFLFCYVLSIIFLPLLYFPQRYLSYVFPIFFVTVIPFIFLRENKIFNIFSKRREIAVVFCTALLIILVGGKVDGKNGFTVNEQNNSVIYDFISGLSAESFFAGWPNKPYMNNLRYLTGRNAYLSYESHQVLHLDYISTMRQKTYAIIDVYMGTQLDDILKFRDNTGVDYLIVDENDFRNDFSANYFAPFDEYIEDKNNEIKKEGSVFILPQLKDKAVFIKNNIFILDLNTL